jgi:hypothetical protein
MRASTRDRLSLRHEARLCQVKLHWPVLLWAERLWAGYSATTSRSARPTRSRPSLNSTAPAPAPGLSLTILLDMLVLSRRYWPRKIMVIFGKPGAGKGTQGPKIVGTPDA